MNPLKLLPAAALVALFATAGSSPALACGEDDYLGSICATAASYCPRGHLPAEGQILQVKDNVALYSLLMNTYGGDGQNTFALPDLRGRTLVGVSPKAPPYSKLGEKRGQDSVELKPATLPAQVPAPTDKVGPSLQAEAQTIPTVPPQMAITYCIKTNWGLYPTRD